MSIDTEFDEMMNDTITVQDVQSLDQYGRHTWATGVEYEGRVSYQTRLIRGMDGREKVSSGRVYIFGVIDPISPDAKLTLPSGATPIISAVETLTDETGYHHTVIHFE